MIENCTEETTSMKPNL